MTFNNKTKPKKRKLTRRTKQKSCQVTCDNVTVMWPNQPKPHTEEG